VRAGDEIPDENGVGAVVMRFLWIGGRCAWRVTGAHRNVVEFRWGRGLRWKQSVESVGDRAGGGGGAGEPGGTEGEVAVEEEGGDGDGGQVGVGGGVEQEGIQGVGVGVGGPSVVVFGGVEGGLG
jgi:hypothetical protein